MGVWAAIKNGVPVPRLNIPIFSMEALATDIASHMKDGLRTVQFFGYPTDDNRHEIIAVLADDTSNSLIAASALAQRGQSYDAITPNAPSLHLFERELHEQTGIIPQRHPWLKPVRDTNAAPHFFKPLGKDAHEVAVGPVHAGIIEPGHFRFICQGEEIYHLQIQLGYQHRGVEALFKEGSPLMKTPLAESIAGDSVIAHAWAHAWAVEALCGTEISPKAEILRAVALELERIAMHLVGLGGVSTDIGYLPGASAYGRIRTAVINTTLMLSGCRFGRGYIRPGGVLSDIDEKLRKHILDMCDELWHDLEIINNCLFNNPGVLSRLEHTGRISTDLAWKTGLVGVIAKSSGLPIDVRADQPYGIYKKDRIDPAMLNSGDVYARLMVRALEITQSIGLIRGWLGFGIMEGDIYNAPSLMAPGRFVVTLVEGWRGEVSHVLITGNNSEIKHYKVVDASFHNWLGLALAVRTAGISDFPVCNKSFDASYAGHDL
ncbi:MAG: NADH-quinone oxidoreductase subunit C [Candidatus Magnetominusculus sp. LBB02]|nr:NADH-quinone oxidoreductase subunit C [Candidatus Magnetominusculus sp. LBB02]